MKNPIKFNFKTEVFPIIVIIMSVIASFFFYSKFPDVVATHWNFEGVADGFSGKAFAAFFFPALILGIYLLFNFLPAIDPKKERYEQFASTYLIFRNIMVFFMTFMYFVASLVNLGYDLNVGILISIGVGVLFIVMGNYMGKLKKNWFIGIKTPWTLSSEEVWNKTHRFSGKIFMICGVIMIVTGYAPVAWRVWLLVGAVVLASVGTIAYSYIAYIQEKKNKK